MGTVIPCTSTPGHSKFYIHPSASDFQFELVAEVICSDPSSSGYLFQFELVAEVICSDPSSSGYLLKLTPSGNDTR